MPFWKQKTPEFDEFGRISLDSFHKVMSKLEFKMCTSCDESWPTLRIRADTGMCWQCSIDNGSDQAGPLTSENNTNPGSAPPLRRDLSAVEEMLIAQIAPMINVFRLPSGRQYGYSGHVSSCTSKAKFRECRVRRDRVYVALVFLKQNN